MGSGPIEAGVPVVVDIWPRDNASAMYCDMTRTFVVGDVPDDVREWHRLCKEALDGAVAAIRPGASGRRRSSTPSATCSRRPASRRNGRRSPASRSPTGSSTGSATASGSRCTRSRDSAWPFGRRSRRRRRHRRAGPLPQGYGGVRLEDLILVTADGAENLTDYPYDLEP